MKKLFYTFCYICVFAAPSFAQTVPVVQPENVVPLSEQEPYQQLIGYALEVGGATFEAGKTLGKYKCESIYSAKGYDAPQIPSCEVIVHSDTGPIVVRYQDVNDDMSSKILAFLVENQLTENVRYGKGRFRFSFDEQEETKKPTKKSEPKKKHKR